MKSEYLEKLKVRIEHRYNCKAVHAASCPVDESVTGLGIWKGTVEIFLLIGSLKANRCFAWSYENGVQKMGDEVVIVLEIPPVGSPQAAVRMVMLAG